MVSVVLTGHGDFAVGLASALEMIAGPQDDFHVVAFHEGEEAALPQKLQELISQGAAQDGCLVLCDLLGGTPFNQSMIAATPFSNVEVVTGANLPMLLEVTSSRMPQTTVEELVTCATEAGGAGVVHPVLDNNTQEADAEDGI